MKFSWEEIWNNQDHHFHQDHWEETSRAKVFGGWIVTHITGCDHVNEKDKDDKAWTERRTSLVFVPDPNHEWEIEKCES